MLGKINEELDSLQKTELRIHFEKIEKALRLAIEIDDNHGLSRTIINERDDAVSSLKEISNFLGI